MDSNQPKGQAGFRSGYLIPDYIHVINQVVGKYAEYTKPQCNAFIDYSVKALRRQVAIICEDIRRYIKRMYCNYKTT